MTESTKASSSIYSHMIRGSVWALLMRFSMRAIGLFNTAILARLLTPDDFGVVAMASITIGLLELVSNFGAYVLLIRESDVTKEECDTAWTIRVAQGALVAVLILVAAPLAASYFQEPRITVVLHLVALTAFIGGLENVGMVLVRKELDFRKDYRFNVYSRLATFCVVLALALALRTYWALVIGEAVGSALRVLLSYMMHTYRPRPSLVNLRKYFKFSLSAVPLNIAFFLWTRADTFVLGRTLTAASLGAYNVASELSQMFTTQLRLQVSRALLPSYSHLRSDEAKLVEAFLNVQTSLLLLIMPMGFGLFAVAGDLIPVVYGDQWLQAIPLLQWTAMYSVAQAMTSPLSGDILIVSGHERLSAIMIWLRLCLVVPSILYAAHTWGPREVPMAAALATCVAAPGQVMVLKRVLPVSARALALSLSRPFIAASSMLLLLTSMPPLFDLHVLSLAADVALGALLYFVLVLLLWKLAGRPAGPEAGAVRFLLEKIHRG